MVGSEETTRAVGAQAPEAAQLVLDKIVLSGHSGTSSHNALCSGHFLVLMYRCPAFYHLREGMSILVHRGNSPTHKSRDCSFPEAFKVYKRHL